MKQSTRGAKRAGRLSVTQYVACNKRSIFAVSLALVASLLFAVPTVAAGAGGHASVKSPFAMIAEIREWFDGPLALSGAIANGGAVLAGFAVLGEGLREQP